MIIYITQKTADRYKLKMSEELSFPLKELVANFSYTNIAEIKLSKK